MDLNIHLMTYISRGNVLDNAAFFALFLHVITGMQDLRKIEADQMALSRKQPLKLHKQDNYECLT